MLPTGEVKAQLERILAGEVFCNADRPKRFLRFLVESAVEPGRAAASEHLVASKVFNRPPSFDPATDAVVRVEAGRLRHKLREYYQTEGVDDPVQIELPARTYTPIFRRRLLEVTQPPLPAPWFRSQPPRKLAVLAITVVFAGAAVYWVGLNTGSGGLPRIEAKSPNTVRRENAPSPLSIIVLPFSDMSAKHDHEYLCDGLVEEVIEALTKVHGVRVVSRTNTFYLKGRADDVRTIGEKLDARLALEGSVVTEDDGVHVEARLINASDGYIVWASSYDRQLKDIFTVRCEIARGIVDSLRSHLTDARWLTTWARTAPRTPAGRY